MKSSAIISTLFFITFSYLLIAQTCPPGGALFVNEIYNGNASSTEYIELVVVGDPADPTAPVNLEGWIIDDNNYVGTPGQGTAQGHLILDATFSSVNPGAIILIYSEFFPYSPLPASNPPWLYVVAGSDIDGCSASPSNSSSNPNYTPCGTPGGSWSYVLLNNINDVVQTRHPDATFYHGVDWGPPLTIIPSITVQSQTASLDCGDWFDPDNYSFLPETPGDFNTELNEALIMDIRNGNLDCDDIAASCVLFTCPEIAAIDFVDAICADELFDITATGLAFMDESLNTETDFGIEFVRFDGATPPADPYSGGTLIGTVANADLSGTSPDQSATINTSMSTGGTFQICAILDPESEEPDCKPFACKTITINQIPQVSLSGQLDFCPGDCHEITTNISGGGSPYSVDFILQIGPISFPFNIPAYDIDNHLNICYDAAGFVPSYDEGTNTLHFPTFVSGSGTIIITGLVDQNGCVPALIDPDFMTLDFHAQPTIFGAGPLEGCDENGDGMAFFDLSSLNNTINGGTGYTVNWFEDMNGTMPIPDPAAYYSSAGNVYVNIQDEHCTSNTISVLLDIVVAPFPGEDDMLEICSTDNTVLNFYLEIGGDPGGIWNDDSNSGVDLSDPATVNFSGISEGTYLFSYSFLANGPCPPVSATLTITVVEPLNPGNDNQIGICFGSTTAVDLETALGDHDTGGNWNDLEGTGVDLTNPSAVDFSNIPVGDYDFSYSLPGNDVCPNQEALIVVSIYEEPNAGVDNLLEVCNSGATVIDLESALGPHDNIGYWSDLDGAMVDLDPPTAVEFIGITPGTYRFSYTIPETDNCPEVSATITVEVIEGSFAGLDSLQQFCQGIDQNIDLFSLIPGATDSSGIWQQLSGDPLILVDPYNVSIESSGPGLDTLLYILNNSCGNDSSMVILDILPALVAGTDYSRAVCSVSDTINLYDSLGVFDLGGIWITENMDTVLNADSLVIAEVDTLNFFYIIGNEGECGSDTSVAIIQVIPSTFAGQDTSFFVCEGTNTLIDLFTLIPGISDSTGTWTQISGDPLDLTPPDSVDLSNSPTGIDSILYIIDGICNTDTALIIVSIDDAPSAGTDYTLTLCETISTINLFDSLSGYTPGGNWYFEDQLIIIDPEYFYIDSSGLINLYYIIPENGSCLADTAIATIQIEQAPYAGTDAVITVCEGSPNQINIFEQLGGDPDSGGTWIDLDGSGIDLSAWNQLYLGVLGIGIYQFAYVVEPGTGSSCPVDTSILTVDIINAPNPGTNNSFSICQSEVSTINLDSLLLDHDPNGVWSDLNTSGVDLTDAENVDFTSVGPGTYRFSYVIPSVNGCPTVLAFITINILDSPDAGEDMSLDFCEGYDLPVDLYNQLSPGVADTGSWQDPLASGIDLSDPSQIYLTDIPNGIFTLEYFINADPACGFDTSYLTITIENAPETGVCDTVYVCNGPSENPVDFFEVLTGEDAGGSFRELTSSGVSLSDPSTISFEGIIEGRYIFEYYFTSSGVCPEFSTRIYVKVLNSSYSYVEQSICPDEFIDIEGQIFDLANPTGEVILSNSIGCDSIITVNLTPRTISADVLHEDANCFDIGSITVTSIEGTELPVMISESNLGLIQINSLPYELDVEQGSYTLNVNNSGGCEFDTTIIIQPFEGFVFELEDEININAGESHQIIINTDMEPVSIEWFPSNGLDCSDCLNPKASPTIDTEYTVTLIDAEGCIITGSIFIKVKTVKAIYLPNAFSPNDDEHNQRFYVKSNQSDGTYSMAIYDRWGEKLYHGTNMPVNDDHLGWDGTFNGIKLNPGIYVYYITAQFPDGTTFETSGDILLLR